MSRFMDSCVFAAKKLAPWAFAISLPFACSTQAPSENVGQNSSALSTTVGVDVDSYVRSGAPTSNFGTATTLLADGDDAGSVLQTYIRFTVPSGLGTLSSVKLRLHVLNSTAGSYTVKRVSDNTWGETTINWNNKPVQGTTITTFPSATAGNWLDIDVTSFASTAGTYSVAIVSGGTVDGVDFDSKQATTTGNRPQVVITSGVSNGTVATDANLKIAFIGDTADGTNWRNVAQLAINEGAAAIVTAGDMTYDADPAGWWAQTESVVGQSYPAFLARGNHDDTSWSGFLTEANNHLGGATRTAGPHNAAYKTVFRGLALATIKLGDTGTTINNLLSGDNHIWRVCNWHQNMNKMQVGGKGDEMGWEVYETCRQQGAIIISGHEHSYHRTKTLTNMQNTTIDSGCSSGSSLCVGVGRSFVTVTGLGGTGIRNQVRCTPASTTAPFPSLNTSDPSCPIWASIYTSDQGATYGAQFITFNVDGNPKKARGYFKTISGQTIDSYTIFHD